MNKLHQFNPTNQSKKVALGMSGGVDSSLSAHLLIEAGYDVIGVFFDSWEGECRAIEDQRDAHTVANQLDIPFQVLDFKQAYKEKVIEYFFQEYRAGRTPNPDVMCNKEIKFGLFYNWAMKHGFDYVATGHYAKTDGINLLVPEDKHKDQTYFLYLLRQEQLQHIRFPLAKLTKQQVRQEAKKREIAVADKKDSVGICFIGDIDVHQFLRAKLGENQGDVIDVKGNVIGKHKGLWFYTIGQRSGFTVNQKTLVKKDDGNFITKHNIPPFYVIEKIPEKNQLVVGFGNETLKQTFLISNLHIINSRYQQLDQLRNLKVRIRHTGKLLNCQVKIVGLQIKIILAQPTRGIAAGQSAVFYWPKNNQTIVVGGGIIS